MKQLTNKEKDILQEILSAYDTLVSEKINSIGDFIWQAHKTGDIASSGKKYTQNIKFFQVKDNIKAMLENDRISAQQLIIKLIKNY